MSLLPAALCAGLAAGQEGPQVVAGGGVAVKVPSGQPVTLQDVIWNVAGPDGMVTRFRFLAPDIAGAVDFDTAETDMIWLCENFALPRLSEFGPQPEAVVISLSDRALDFGDSAPEAVQFFESYRVEGGKCEWEMF
ncbi:DUF6497 family protein [Paragemmobacter straminiformis]|uniref:DUF6497 family protein n=1 Tax=Paragemmobacter straminiformis TaxID=2045119 RepID=UPI001F513407|nr:DUF6497 family protein [Gemmobacter straminiformis]